MVDLITAKLRLAKWAARSLTAEEIEKANRWPAGAPGSKGGQFAPANGGAGGGGKPAGKAGAYGYAGKGGAWPGEAGGAPKPVSYPNAKAHPKRGDNGEPITIKEPTRPSDPKEWANPAKTATFVAGGAAPKSLNGVKMEKWHDAPKSISDWAKVPGQNPVIEAANPFTHNPEKRTGAGVIIQEPDGRVWLTSPTNAFGGYRQTLPKGGVEDGLNLQASAIKEAYEETGLQVRIVGVLGDYERSTSKARYYVAERVGGTPADMGWESQALRLSTRNDLQKLLNVAVDRDIMDDFFDEQEFFKQAPAKGGASWMKQERWPGGTPLGGQWKAMGADGLTTPPKVAGGLEGSNKVYQKSMNAAHAAAQAGDVKTTVDAAVVWAKKAKALTDKGAKSSHVKWTAQVAQYLQQLVVDMAYKPKAEAVAERLTGPFKVSSLKAVGGKPGGSNPGGMYEDGKGAKWLVKGNLNFTQGMTTGSVSDNRARNEVLAAKLLKAAGVGAPDMKLTDLEGQHGGSPSGVTGSMGVASKIIDGLSAFNPNNAAHVAAAQADFAVHAWLGNWDVLGASWDNTMIDKDGKAVCIDTGGAILFRAQGSPKSAGQFSATADDWETMRSTDAKQKAIYGKMTASQLADSAAKLANISDDTIRELVKTSGLEDDLADTLIARRDAILAKAGVTASKGESGLTEAKPVDPPEPPKLTEAVKPAAPVDPVPGLQKPSFSTGLDSDAYYSGLADKMEAAHAQGDIDALAALGVKQYGKNKGKTSWKSGTPNGSKMAAYHGALMADLKAKQGDAIVQVATGQATVTGKDGTEWTGKNGVLEPVAAAMPESKGSPDHLLPPKIEPYQSAPNQNTYAAVGPASLKFAHEAATGKSKLPTKGMTKQLLDLAKSGDIQAVQAFPAALDDVALKTKLLFLMGAHIPDEKGQKVKAQSDFNLIVNAVGGADAIKALPENELKTISVHLYHAAHAGDLGAVKGAVVTSDIGVHFKNILISMMSGQTPTPEQAAALKPGAKPAPAAPDFKPHTQHEVKLPTGALLLKPIGLKGDGAMMTQLAGGYHSSGNIGALKNMLMTYGGWKSGTPGHTKIKAYIEAAIKELEAKAPAPAAAPSEPRQTATPTPAAPAPATPPAGPDFEAFKTSSTANPGHNPKVDAIAAAFAAGDVASILAMSYGTNTYGKKQAQAANDALAALGSPHKVEIGQKKGAHPALIGGAAQAPAAPPAATPKADPSDASWVKLGANEKVVEIKEQFGVKSAVIEVAAKGYDPTAFGDPPDFFQIGKQGPTKTWVSSKEEVNNANNAAVQAIFDAATKGGSVDKLTALKFPIVEGGNVTMVDISGHKAAGVKEYHSQVKAELEAQLQPTYKVQHSGSMTASYDNAAHSIAQSYKVKDYKEFKAHAKKAADYLVLSQDAAASVPVPAAGQFKETGPAFAAYKSFRSASIAAYNSMTASERSAAKDYTGSSYWNWNAALRTGDVENSSFDGAQPMVAAFKKAAVDVPEGSILWRGIDVGQSTYESVVGGVIQDGSFNSMSYGQHPGGGFKNKPTWLRIHVGKGFKAVDATSFSNFDSSEAEIIARNNSRYMVLKVEHHTNFKDSNGKSHGPKTIVDVIALPHDV